MKQIIISKCFGKMKRVGLALLAALCVGSVWAGHLTFDVDKFTLSEDGTITFDAVLGYHGTTTERFAQLTATGYNENGDKVFENKKVIDYSTTKVELENEFEGGDGYITYPCTISDSGLNATENYKIEFHFWAVKSGGATSADYDTTHVVSAPIGISRVKVKYGDLLFRISGNVDDRYPISTIKVNYILGTGTPNLVKEATIDSQTKTFICEIPYTPIQYTLTYSIVVEYTDGTSKTFSSNEKTTFARERLKADNIKVIYTWTGEGDGTSWTDELNWTVNSEADTVGYPGTHDGSYYRTLIYIPNDVECIDLQGGTYGFPDDGGLFISANKTVKFKNGKFRFTNGGVSRTKSDLSGDAIGLIGSNGGTLIFENVLLRQCMDSGSEMDGDRRLILGITPCAGATVVFEGTYTDAYWDYCPKSDQKGTKFIIRDGQFTVGRNLYQYADGSQNDVLISNAKWTINDASTKAITPYKTLTFRDGPDRQAQIENKGDLKLLGTYDFALPATPYSTPYYTLRYLASADAGTIKVDVTNYKGGGLVPLIAFTGTLNANTKNAMNTITTTASKLIVNANGVDVKAARNAKLVWNETAKTLYFQQDSQNAASIGTAEYATLGAAVEAATSGATIKLLNDVVVETVVVVPTGATLDLNGNTLQAAAVVGKLAMNGGALKTYDTNTQTYFFMAAPAQTAGALYWTSDAVMTIGADYTLSLDGGSVTLPNSWRSLLKQSLTIKSGASFEIPQGVELNLRGNAVVEEGATLTCEGTIALGNTYDAIDTSATLTSVQLAEGKVVSAVEGYKVQYADGKYTLVKEGYTLTIIDPSVTVQTEAAANAVKLNVVAPENLTADEKAAYLGYFEKKITANAEGGYTVELALVDEVKPVIATTIPAITFEDGKVTVNIENEIPGLYYGVRYATTVEAVDAAEIVSGFTVTPAAGDTAGFFKVVVDFKEIK